jgi:hypothetical protein
VSIAKRSGAADDLRLEERDRTDGVDLLRAGTFDILHKLTLSPAARHLLASTWL